MPHSVAEKEFLPRGPYEVFVSRFIRFGAFMAVTGEAGLNDLLHRPVQLERLTQSCELLGGSEPFAQRFCGPLDSCLIRLHGVWHDLARDPSGRRYVIGLDVRRGRVYAFREGDDGLKSEIGYAEIRQDGAPPVWHRLCGLPEDASCFVDASHFVQGDPGPAAIIRMRNTRDAIEHRLLTIEERPLEHGTRPLPHWSDRMSERYSVVHVDRRPVMHDLHGRMDICGLLVEERLFGGYRLKRLALAHCSALPAYAYIDRERRLAKTPSLIPPVLSV
ncbi:MAG TPA: hypothetical protein VMU11_02745 [Verrucomicrobiae bacterium]|nr:hypothetical protein [Verrucomicrobiae bacterium]